MAALQDAPILLSSCPVARATEPRGTDYSLMRPSKSRPYLLHGFPSVLAPAFPDPMTLIFIISPLATTNESVTITYQFVPQQSDLPAHPVCTHSTSCCISAERGPNPIIYLIVLPRLISSPLYSAPPMSLLLVHSSPSPTDGLHIHPYHLRPT